jgi:hypothetical protein
MPPSKAKKVNNKINKAVSHSKMEVTGGFAAQAVVKGDPNPTLL